MSTITITIETQPQDFSPITLGQIQFDITHQGSTVTLIERLANISGFLNFLRVEYFTPQEASDGQQAANYAAAFNRDHTNVFNPPSTGGPQIGNLAATVNGNVVTITAQQGTFSNASYTGNSLQAVTFDINNSVQETPKTFDFTRTTTGDCTNIQYTAQAATGGTGTYRLELLGTDIFTNWDGNADINFNLQRGKAYSGFLYDSNNEVIRTVQIIVPRKIAVGDFTETINAQIGSSDLVVNTVNEINGTTPLEYALNDGAFQASNSFGGQVPGLYTLKIRDVYGCEISKQIEIFEFTDPNSSNESLRHFSISEYNSLSFSEHLEYSFDTRKNHENTLSHEEEVGINYQSIFCFPSTSRIRTQFKSSYDIHVCTLIQENGSKTSIPLVQTQQHIGAIERVDCKLFPVYLDFGIFTLPVATGVYFEGGNQYLPNTSTIDPENPSSPYNKGIPEWAKEGAFVTLDGLGTYEILETDVFDSVRGVVYFKIQSIISAEQDAITQVQFNRHPYNTYRMDFDMSEVSSRAMVRIEAGWDVDGQVQIERRFDSEKFEELVDDSNYLKITWDSDVNFDDMVFADGIGNDEGCQMWVKGSLRPFSIASSETQEADDRTRSLKQRFKLGMRLSIPLLTAKQFEKLGLASGISDDGEFRIQDLLLVTLEPPSEEPIGDTNLYEVTAEYAYDTEILKVKEGEIVLNPDTGIEGTGQTGQAPPIVATGLRLLRTSDGRWLQDSQGRYLSL